MKITIVTVYRDHSSEHYVAAVEGSLTEEQRDAVASGFCCVRTKQFKDDELEEVDQVFFRETEAVPLSELKKVVNIDGETYPD